MHVMAVDGDTVLHLLPLVNPRCLPALHLGDLGK